MKKHFLPIAIIAITILFGLFEYKSIDGRDVTKSLTISEDLQLSIDGRATASADLLPIAPYKSVETFISDEKKTDFQFTAVGGDWEEFAPEGTAIQAEIRFKTKSGWSEWVALEEEEESFDPSTNIRKRFVIAASNPAESMQYKFMMYGDGAQTPVVKKANWTFINAGKKNSNVAPPKSSGQETLSVNSFSSLTAGVSGIGVISRKSWGADESLRYAANNKTPEQLANISSDTYAKFKDEMKMINIIDEDQDGKAYKWPLEYPEKVRKIIIHHTATTQGLDNPAQAIRDIYYYHAVTRGWGDIGYNYIVDKNGSIYEGRYGGESVIGAHASIGNNGSIGIAVLGNYQEAAVSESTIGSLTSLIAQKAKIHNIDPVGFSTFRGENRPNIFGHRDISSTSCPGAKLYEKFDVIRNLSATKMADKKKFVIDYDFEDRSDVHFLDMTPQESKSITVKFENIGKQEWNSETYLSVSSNSDISQVLSFPDAKGNIIAKLNESKVKPGDKGSFTFKVKALKSGASVSADLSVFANGKNKISDFKALPVFIGAGEWKYEFVSSKYPAKLKVGEKFSGWVKLKNTGSNTWNKTGQGVVKIGTEGPRDRLSQFVSPANARIGTLQESKVEPGEVGTFKFDLVAPKTPGVYTENFAPVVEAVTWMANSGMNFKTLVYTDTYAAQFVVRVGATNWKRGGEYIINFRYRNIGEKDWQSDNFNLNVVAPKGVTIKQKSLVEKTVKSGEIGTLRLLVTIDKNAENTKGTFEINPLVNKTNKLLKTPLKVNYIISDGTAILSPIPLPSIPVLEGPKIDKVGKVTQGKGVENQIRVKISFTGNPEITADGGFDLVVGGKSVKSLVKDQVATVKYDKSSYVVTIDSKDYSYTSFPRFVPKNGAILQIRNYENRPAWNDLLNDNQYRGVLEVRQVDNVLEVINELPLEDYMKGIAEVPNGMSADKIKTILVAARTYAKYYVDIDVKFKGKPYHLTDDPDRSQKYLGYGFEKRAPNVVKAVAETKGQVVTYGGKLIKTPYFNESDGVKTKSAKEVWGWTTTPHLQSVVDPYCKSSTGGFKGHGVGISGCGADTLAGMGYNYVSIIKYYYTGVEVTDIY